MQLAKVIGKATATVKHPTLEGRTLLIVEVLDARGEAGGEPLIAVDELGSAVGDRVMVALDGSAIRELLGVNDSPARCIVLGQVDEDRRRRSDARRHSLSG
jgi:microcompartment protein CcmK/EutM